ncbi:aldehyde dehydrogenase family protein [Streptomyces ipomoeae]|uniref:Aldehyde dehydrogenase n=1 Tax=Streptomyces ipomoeae TaxID=103232 RepID=A0AAE9B1K8_9ACTN|nr:aldehyde dehydrogenase family protein [Streptomyces ipomoeae]MDX2821899.1 aldehyde dehydrogenase family protein [Streptomyces ipomoeae]MDX2874244.1 aldehyde dehydrogenase family protein [Streptomyces ipomoeae]TQE35875.1 aldehyde dehydrogenase family protein [Streptomyces ipomoeae]
MSTLPTAPDLVGPQPLDPPAAVQRRLLDAQREAFLAEGPPALDVRLDRIDRLLACVLEHTDELCAALDADFGSRPLLTSLASDIIGAVPDVRLIRENLAGWMEDEEVPGSAEAGRPAFVQTRPKGVVGVVGPWNFPVTLVVQPAIEALAAGNRVMIKFSEVAERTAEVFARAVASRMSPEEVVVVRGGVATASAFSSLPFDHLIFTGSPGVGARVAATAGENLVPVTLELGGKNPVVLGSDADVALAAERVAAMRLLNGGQICLCPDYVFVTRDRVEEFLAVYEQSVRAHFPTYLDNPDVVSIIDDRNFDRVTGLVADAESKGARVLAIAPPQEADALPRRAGRRIAPTVLLDVTEDMAVASEEIFGPALAVYPYDDLDDVITYVNTRPSPLAAYFFGSDGPEFREFIRRTTSGGVSRNDLAVHWGIEGAPSGGIGRSGMGAYHGKVGFLTFSHRRTIAASTAPTGMAQNLMPPAGQTEADALRGFVAHTLDDIRHRIGDGPSPQRP